MHNKVEQMLQVVQTTYSKVIIHNNHSKTREDVTSRQEATKAKTDKEI